MKPATPRTVEVATADSRYDILIARGLLNDPATWMGLPNSSHAVIVSNPTVDALYGATLNAAIATHHARVSRVLLPDGEAHKTWDSLNLIFDHLLGQGCDRRTVLYALGGGVVGDMTGFAAATYMRGVPFVQVPTTLLAQVDSSVGGKTAINHPLGKNMIGAFYQPARVVCDLSTLGSLPPRELSAGLAEVIKYGPIADMAFFDWIEANIDALRAHEPEALAHAVQRSCQIKAEVVGQDERESGLRAILNFGHTFGHAIEAGMGYGAWLHGESVGCGMVLAAELSAALGLLPAAFVERLTRLVARAGLPVHAPAMPGSRWLELMRVDKKAEAGAIRFVVIDGPGRAAMRSAPDELVLRVIQQHTAPGGRGSVNASGLAPWASDPQHTRGRRVAEAPSPPRTEHQRDRDRIVHSTAFRRLVYKTQVFLNHEGDLFRTRLTHSLEVAQLGRSAARALRLNEDLVEAIALAHDLGHTPFGHAGQDALHACMQAHGGFEHNLQSLRVVDELEARYPRFDGLNLCFETREGILKHCSPRNAQRLAAAEPGGPAQRFLDGTQPSLEAQLVNLADEMAYNAHDIDDGVRSGLLTLAQLEEVPLFQHWRQEVLAEHPQLAEQPGRRLLFETLRRLLSAQIGDLISHTAQALAAAAPANADAARRLPPLVGLSPGLQAQNAELKRFLFRELYRHPQVVQSTTAARRVVGDLFAAYTAQPAEMPEDYAGAADTPRAVADYIAGMTDRYALREHHRLTGQRLFADAL